MAAVTVSVVFTDLVGSTELASRLGPEQAEALRLAHFAALRGAVAEAGGTEVKNLGDGLMVVFPSIGAALDGAVAVQQRIHRHNRTSTEPLAVRVGVSSGDAVEQDGDYFGDPVVEAARLCGLAAGGQILTTDLVRMLVSRSGHEFRSVGDLELKGLPGTVAAQEVVWAPARSIVDVPLPTRLTGRPWTGFVGRLAERERIEQTVKGARVGDGRGVVLLAGEAGMGKTTLIAGTAQAAHDDGAVVLYGRCDEELALPYQPFVEALGHWVDHADDDGLARVDGASLVELTRLLPGLRTRRPDLVAPERDPEAERYLLFGAVTALVEAAAGDGPVLLVLDDLHWADKPTVLLLRHLAASLHDAPVVLLGTYRDTDITATHPLSEALAALRREPNVERIALRGLDDVELISMMEGIAGHAMDDVGVSLAHELRRETDGNPFFTGELLRHLAESGQIRQNVEGRWETTVGIHELGLPESVREVVGQRIRRLGDDALRVLSQAAVIGRDFDLQLLAALVERSEDEVLDVLEEARRARVVDEAADVPDRFTFNHALIQHTLYDDLGASRRSRAHRRVAALLEAECGDDPGERIGELARHWIAATRPADLDKAVDYARRAGERALDQLAPDEAVRWFDRALQLHGDAFDDCRCRLLVGLGEGQKRSGDPAFRATLLDAAALAQRLGATDLLVRAALANNRGFVSQVGVVDRERVAVLEDALAAIGDADSADRARLLAVLGTELNYAGDYPRRRALSDEAVAVARRVGDDATLLHVLLLRHDTIRCPETVTERAESMAECRALAERSGDKVALFWALHWSMYPAIETGDRRRIDDVSARKSALASAIGDPSLLWNDTFARAGHLLIRGDADGGERLATEALQMGTDIGQPDALAIFGAALTVARRHQGRLAETVPAVQGFVDANPGLPAYRAVLSLALVEAGDVAGARSLLGAALDAGFDTVPMDYLWLDQLMVWADVAAAVGDAAAAAALQPLLLPWHDQVEFTGASSLGPVAHVLGVLAGLLADREAAAAHFAEALAIARRLEAPFFEARSSLAWAELLLSQDRPEYRARGRELAERASDLAAAHGCDGVLARAEALLASTVPPDV